MRGREGEQFEIDVIITTASVSNYETILFAIFTLYTVYFVF